MNFLKSKAGFTLIEILVAITLIGFAVGLIVSVINFQDRTVSNGVTKMKNDFAAMEMAFTNYASDKNAYPTGLTDTTFVNGVYLFVPAVLSGFDASYGTNGFTLAERTGQASPNNGWYVCVRVAVTGATDAKFKVLKQMSAESPSGKFFYSSACPGTANMADPGGAVTAFGTYWISRN